MSTEYDRVCQWLASHCPASIQDFMEALNIPKSTAHRHIAKLIADGWGVNYQSAVFAGYNTGVERIIVQRNKLHHPRSDANSWAEYRALCKYPGPEGQALGYPWKGMFYC